MKTIKELLRELKSNEFVLGAKMPLGYVAGYPMLGIKADELCITVPFLYYKSTGEVDKTLVFPIRYILTMTLPEQGIVSFNDLSYSPMNIDFHKPICLFRHEAIKNLDKKAYSEKQDELFSLYDKVISHLLTGSAYTAEDESRMSQLLNLLLEPELRPFYKKLAPDFYKKYFNK